MNTTGINVKIPSLFLFYALIFCCGANATDKSDSRSMDVKQYSELGKFSLPASVMAQSTTLYVVKFNGKAFILSDMPDRRLYDLTINKDSNGREVLCGKTGGGLEILNCYYIYFREN